MTFARVNSKICVSMCQQSLRQHNMGTVITNEDFSYNEMMNKNLLLIDFVSLQNDSLYKLEMLKLKFTNKEFLKILRSYN